MVNKGEVELMSETSERWGYSRRDCQNRSWTGFYDLKYESLWTLTSSTSRNWVLRTCPHIVHVCVLLLSGSMKLRKLCLNPRLWGYEHYQASRASILLKLILQFGITSLAYVMCCVSDYISQHQKSTCDEYSSRINILKRQKATT